MAQKLKAINLTNITNNRLLLPEPNIFRYLPSLRELCTSEPVKIDFNETRKLLKEDYKIRDKDFESALKALIICSKRINVNPEAIMIMLTTKLRQCGVQGDEFPFAIPLILNIMSKGENVVKAITKRLSFEEEYLKIIDMRITDTPTKIKEIKMDLSSSIDRNNMWNSLQEYEWLKHFTDVELDAKQRHKWEINILTKIAENKLQSNSSCCLIEELQK